MEQQEGQQQEEEEEGGTVKVDSKIRQTTTISGNNRQSLSVDEIFGSVAVTSSSNSNANGNPTRVSQGGDRKGSTGSSCSSGSNGSSSKLMFAKSYSRKRKSNEEKRKEWLGL